MATKNKRAKTMPKTSMKSVKGGAWYAKYDGMDGAAKQEPLTLVAPTVQVQAEIPQDQLSFNYGK
ncbi:MAG TPA: hypothetical protein VF950_15090 [Planctomycetota bacterium]